MRVLFFVINFIVCFTAISSARCFDVETNSFVQDDANGRVERNIVEDFDGYTVTYLFKSANVVSDDIFEGAETWNINGFYSVNVPGQPIYPYSSDSFVVDEGSDISYKIIEEEWVESKTTPAPGRPFIDMNEDRVLLKEDIPEISMNDDWFPNNVITDNGSRMFQGHKISSVGLYPVQFNVKEKKVRICKKLVYKVKVENIANINSTENLNGIMNAYNEALSHNNGYLSQIALNWNSENNMSLWSESNSLNNDRNSISSNSIKLSLKNEYLIFSHPDLMTAVNRLVQWKKKLGFKVSAVYSENWTPESITNYIIGRCEEGKRPYYMLFFGNQQQVPADIVYNDRTIGTVNGSVLSTYEALSDLEYALIPRNLKDDFSSYEDVVPDVKCGRIIVNNVDEANIVVDKIIKYESNPPLNEDFYSSLFLSRFYNPENANPPYTGTESSFYIFSQLSYEASEYLKELGGNASLELYANDFEYPDEWGLPCIKRNSDGCTVITEDKSIPSYLQKTSYSWNANSETIVNRLNSGYANVFYYGHGFADGFEKPDFKISNISALRNSNYLPVVFSMACLTGNFGEKQCLAEKFLNSNNGAIAFYGFTNTVNNAFAAVAYASIFNGMYPNPGFSPLIGDKMNVDGNHFIILIPDNKDITPITELGELNCFIKAKIRDIFPHDEYHNSYIRHFAAMFTLFGDPSMKINTSKPHKLNVTITQNEGYLIINSPRGSVINIYDSMTNDVINLLGGSNVKYKLPSLSTGLSISVTKDGYIPYLYSNFQPILRKSSKETFIREDRIWRYKQQAYDAPVGNHIYVNLRFDGVTEFDGIKYNNLYAWPADEEYSVETAVPVGYMREDGDRVYAYYGELLDTPAINGTSAECYNEAFYKKYGIPLYCIGPTTYSNNFGINEYMIYDFSYNKKEPMYLIDYPENISIGNRLLYLAPQDWGNVVFDGREINYCVFLRDIYEFKVYSKFGADHSFLPYPGSKGMYSANYWKLLTVEDLEGNILFDTSKLETGINDIVTDEPYIVSESYYNPQGQQLESRNSKGLVISLMHMSDGTYRTSKILNR